MEPAKMTSRKFWFCVGAFATFALLLVFHFLSEATFQVLVIAIIGGYLTANVVEGMNTSNIAANAVKAPAVDAGGQPAGTENP